MSSEQDIIDYEDARNKAMGEYFKARPSIVRTSELEQLFMSGFRMAWYESRGRVIDLDRKLNQAIDMLNAREKGYLLAEWASDYA